MNTRRLVGGGGGWTPIRRTNRGFLLPVKFPGDLYDVRIGPEKNRAASVCAATQVQIGRGGLTSSGFLFEEAEGGSETDVYQDTGAGFQRRYCRMVKGSDVAGHASSAVRGKSSHPEGGETGPASGVFADTRIATKIRSDTNRCGQ